MKAPTPGERIVLILDEHRKWVVAEAPGVSVVPDTDSVVVDGDTWAAYSRLWVAAQALCGEWSAVEKEGGELVRQLAPRLADKAAALQRAMRAIE